MEEFATYAYYILPLGSGNECNDSVICGSPSTMYRNIIAACNIYWGNENLLRPGNTEKRLRRLLEYVWAEESQDERGCSTVVYSLRAEGRHLVALSTPLVDNEYHEASSVSHIAL